MFPNLVEVYRARDALHANLLKARLEDAGIPTRIEGEILQGVAGGVPAGWPTSPQLLVSEADSSRARSLLADIERETSDRSSQ
jgi:hypothetical protein